MRPLTDDEHREKLADFLELIAARVRKGDRAAYDFAIGINTPVDEAATIGVETEVMADDETIERASELM